MSRAYAPNDAVVVTELDGEAILLNCESGVFFGLNALGTRIWQLLVMGEDEESISTVLLTEYAVDEARLRADLSKFLLVLVAKGLAHDACSTASSEVSIFLSPVAP